MPSRVGGVPPQDMMMRIHEVLTQNIPSKQVSYQGRRGCYVFGGAENRIFPTNTFFSDTDNS